AGAAPAATVIASFSDPTGDAGSAPDIGSVIVIGDDTTGSINIHASFPALPALRDGDVIEVFFDTDQNPSTGDPNAAGAEYGFQMRGPTPPGFGLFQWNGSAYIQIPAPADRFVNYDASGMTFRFNRSDLGITQGFNFWMLTINNPPPTNGNTDTAPDGNDVWTFSFHTSSPQLSKVVERAVGTPRAGQTFKVEVNVVATQNGNTIMGPPDTLTCSATVAAVRIRTHAVRAGAKRDCVMTLPAKAKGKQLVVALRAAYLGKPLSLKSIRLTVR